jgi:hypothetical protein
MSRSGWIIAACVIVACITAPAYRGRASSAPEPQEATKRERWTLPREDARDLQVSTKAGGIVVVAGEQDQIQIAAVKSVRAAERAEAEAFLERITVARRREGGRWVVEATWPVPRPRGVSSTWVSFEIRVPPAMGLQAKTGAGNLEATGTAETLLAAGAGSVTARTVRGGLNAHTGAGNITVEGCAGPVEASAGAGSLRIVGAQGKLKASTGAGEIDAAVSGEGAPEVALEAGAGEIRLRLPEKVSARVVGQTGVGQVEMAPGTGARYNTARTRVEATLGAGQGTIRLHTGTGGIRIRLG